MHIPMLYRNKLKLQISHKLRLGLMIIVALYAFSVSAQITTYFEAIAWSPSGDLIAYSYSYGSPRCNQIQNFVYVIDAVTGNPVQTLLGGDCATWSLDWNPTEDYLVGASLDAIGFRIWDVNSGDELASAQLAGQGVVSAKWHPALNQIASTGIGGGIALFDAKTGEYIRPLTVYANVTQFDWDPSGTQLAGRSLYDSSTYILDATTGEIEHTLIGHTTNGGLVTWSDDGTKIASASFDDNTVRLWNAINGQPLTVWTVSNITDIEWAPDSRRIAIASNDGFAQVWDSQTEEVLETFSNSSGVRTLSWSPNGEKIAYGGADSSGNPPEIEIVDAPVIAVPITGTPDD